MLRSSFVQLTAWYSVSSFFSISFLFVLPYLSMHSKRQLTKTTTKSSKRNKINKAAAAEATSQSQRKCSARRHFCISMRMKRERTHMWAHIDSATVNRPSMTKHLNYPACVVHTCSCDALCNGFELFNSLVVYFFFSLFFSFFLFSFTLFSPSPIQIFFQPAPEAIFGE